MPESKIPSRLRRITKVQKFSAIGITAAAGAATLALSLTPGTPGADAGATIAAEPVTLSADIPAQRASLGKQHKAAVVRADKAEADKKAEAADKKAAEEAKRKAEAAKKKAEKKAEKKAATEQAAKKAKEERAKKQAASRAAKRAKPSYSNNLDGWIRESLDIMKAKRIPGSYEGIHRNIMRESSGNPRAINNWDINAKNGTPSIGLLQVIKPTFQAYHVEGTKKDLYDPVANIVAACNYAADRYGSMDNVNGPY